MLGKFCNELLIVPRSLSGLSRIVHKGMVMGEGCLTKSSYDKRKYRRLTLDNGLKVLLVSDLHKCVSLADSKQFNGLHGQNSALDQNSIEDSLNDLNLTANAPSKSDETKKAAVGLCVDVGGLHEPREVPGLAHFMEHMVFMGSELYPGENDLDTFLSSHGGYSNASTTTLKTVYQFEVIPEFMKEAIKIFAQFFISPLLRVDSVDRELQAVDNEFKLRLQEDGPRLHELMIGLTRDDHPIHKFTWGNQESLKNTPAEMGIDVMQHLREFFKKYYTSERMTVAICSAATLDELEMLARENFSTIKQGDQSDLEVDYEQPSFEESAFHKLYHVVPVQEVHELRLTWNLPPQHHLYRYKSGYYLQWLIGHECKGSIYSLLKEKGYVTSLNCYESRFGFGSNKFFTQFNCILELTDEGMNHVPEVIHTVFQYLHMLRTMGPSEDVYNMIKKMTDNDFQWMEPDDPVSYVEELCHNMQIVKDDDVLRWGHQMDEFRPDLISDVLDRLRPDSVNIMFLSKLFKSRCKLEEKWFKTKYNISEIPADYLDGKLCSLTNPRLHLPTKNRFVAECFHLKEVETPTKYPVLIEDCNKGKLWFKQDDKFRTPKATIYMKLATPVVSESIYNWTSFDTFVDLFDYITQDLSYEADCAELSFRLTACGEGLCLYASGFDDKLKLLFEKVVDELVNFNFTERQFEIVKEDGIKNFKNFSLDPDDLRGELEQYVMSGRYWTTFGMLKVLKDLTSEDILKVKKEVFSCVYVESLCQGNITREDALWYQNHLLQRLNPSAMSPEAIIKNQVMVFPPGRSVCRQYGINEDDRNTSITNQYQIGPVNLHDCTKSMVLMDLMSEPCFDVLRTQQQLGYSVYSDYDVSCGVNSVSISVTTECHKFSPEDIDDRITKFLVNFTETLKGYDKEFFNKHVNSLIDNNKQADLSLFDEASRNWAEIFSGRLFFDWREKQIEHLASITQDEVIDWYEEKILNKNNAKVLCVQVIGQGDADVTEDEDESDDEQDDDEDNGDDEDEEQYAWNLEPVDGEQFQRVITDVSEFKHKHKLYPFSLVR